ncbi:MAG: hypothetical protein IIZ06_05205 [Kiritimatiellae bacterium]|nr:hypothetical protein [Kiritimatiellia bacterium]
MTLGFDKERLKVALGEARSAIDELTRNHGAELPDWTLFRLGHLRGEIESFSSAMFDSDIPKGKSPNENR